MSFISFYFILIFSLLALFMSAIDFKSYFKEKGVKKLRKRVMKRFDNWDFSERERNEILDTYRMHDYEEWLDKGDEDCSHQFVPTYQLLSPDCNIPIIKCIKCGRQEIIPGKFDALDKIVEINNKHEILNDPLYKKAIEIVAKK
jgi:hypothetical protein